jgi:hypothetical protein
MHYYEGPLPTPNTREHWQFCRPYGKCVFADGWVVLFNRGYQAIFERRPGQAATVIEGRPNATPHGAERTTFFYDDGTDPRMANRRIDAELTALELPPLPPMPRLSIDETLDQMRTRLCKVLWQWFPQTQFYIDCMSGIDGAGRWTGSNQVSITWVDGPTKTAVSMTVRGHYDGASIMLDRRLLNYH